MIKTKRWLKTALKKQLENLHGGNWENTINETINLLIDYWNTTQDRELDKYIYAFADSDYVEDYIANKVKEDGVYWTAKLIESVDGTYDYYRIDDIDGSVYCIDDSDVEERLNDMISEL